MTAYVLRAMILYDIPDIEVEGSYIARWLVAQRNPRGGFSSTQVREKSWLAKRETSHAVVEGRSIQFSGLWSELP